MKFFNIVNFLCNYIFVVILSSCGTQSNVNKSGSDDFPEPSTSKKRLCPYQSEGEENEINYDNLSKIGAVESDSGERKMIRKSVISEEKHEKENIESDEESDDDLSDYEEENKNANCFLPMPYRGSKRFCAKEVAKVLSMIIEKYELENAIYSPFCGTGAIEFACLNNGVEKLCLNDLSHKIAFLMSFLINYPYDAEKMENFLKKNY